ncbi:hypothetical protein NDU88_001823 [Pleurodeles waltl]|uniref:Uncharacterized protein n=1 Tax=Pleurodeles waltl TaxID=8319 RepID=A0AAV7TIV7_PLEWA|nr:hypothetical protein NDU88_001823 [Pleurodeles waltl]
MQESASRAYFCFETGTLTARSRLLCQSADSTLSDASAPPEGALSHRSVFRSAFPSVSSHGFPVTEDSSPVVVLSGGPEKEERKASFPVTEDGSPAVVLSRGPEKEEQKAGK